MDKFKSFDLSALKTFFQNKTNLILVAVIVVLLAGSVVAVNAFLNRIPTNLPIEEIDLAFDPEGPYAILTPRRDGNALVLDIYRVSSYESISYELTYQSTISETENTTAEEAEGATIDRGVQGTVNTQDRKSEYSQEILFGTCSQGYTEGGAHCVFDKNVENGTLTLLIKKAYQRGDKTTKIYKMTTAWHLQKPEVALGAINSADSHFSYKTEVSREELTTTGFSIINDLTAVPKLPDSKAVFGKVYALNVPKARTIPPGEVNIETIENPIEGAKLYYFDEKNNKWQELDTKIEKNKLSTQGPGSGIYAVLTDLK